MAQIKKDAKLLDVNVERFEYLSSDEESKNGLKKLQTMGTVTMTEDKDIYLVPAPSADPRGDWHALATDERQFSDYYCRPSQLTQMEKDCLHFSCFNL